MHKVGIIGAGWVGTACEIGFSSMPHTEVMVHDKYKPTDSLRTVVSNSNILFVCVPTPMREDGSCDTSIVHESVRQIAQCSRTPKAIVIKSTVSPGTTNTLQLNNPSHRIFFNPEFLTEKDFITDFCNQELIILGQPEAAKNHDRFFLENFYNDFIRHQKKEKGRVFWVNSTTAEMIKYTANCFLATKVSFFNEIYEICNQIGADYNALINVLKNDKRIGSTHLQVPGPDGQFGFGKSCFPKDIQALIALCRKEGVDPLVLESVWAKNLMVREVHDWEKLPQVNGNYINSKKEAS